MTQTTDAALVERLRDEARELQKAAWGRADGGQDCSISSMLAEEAADTIEAQARRIEALEGALRPMSEAPRDRFILAMYRSVDGHRAHMDGRVFTVRHEGKTVSDFDLGWALYPGYGGVPDVSFYGWMDMPAALAKAPTP